MKREPTALQAEMHGALADPPPLVVEFPMRENRFTAQVRLPLDVTSAEINRVRLFLEGMERESASAEARHSRDGLSVLQRNLERADKWREPIGGWRGT